MNNQWKLISSLQQISTNVNEMVRTLNESVSERRIRFYVHVAFFGQRLLNFKASLVIRIY